MKINTEGVQSVASEIETLVSSLNVQLTSIRSTVAEMKNNWESTESSQFFTSISDKYCTELENLINDLKSYQIFLSKVPGSYTLLDEDFGSREIGS